MYNKNELDNDLNNFLRLIKLKAHFKDSINYDTDGKGRMFKPNKNKSCTPDKNHHATVTYVKKDIECTKTFKLKQPHPNLDNGEGEEIKELSKSEDIIITNTDKRGAIIIVDTTDYIKQGERQLNDKENYHILPQDPTLDYNKLVNQAIDRFKKEKLITDKIAVGLKTSDPKTLRVSITPKIHKPGSPGHLVVNSVNCNTANRSKYIDYHLQPLVK